MPATPAWSFAAWRNGRTSMVRGLSGHRTGVDLRRGALQVGETKKLYCAGQSSTVLQSIRTHSHSRRVQAAAREGVAADDTQDGIDWTLAPRQTYPGLWAAPLAGKGTRRCCPRSLNSGGHTQPQQALARPWHAERQRAPFSSCTLAPKWFCSVRETWVVTVALEV